jgi:cytidylate kinase
VAPLRSAEDALLLDTSNLDIDGAFAAALALVSPAVENALISSAKG